MSVTGDLREALPEALAMAGVAVLIAAPIVLSFLYFYGPETTQPANGAATSNCRSEGAE